MQPTTILEPPFRPHRPLAPMACTLCENPLKVCPKCERLVCSKTVSNCKHLRCDGSTRHPLQRPAAGRSLLRRS